MDYIKNHGNVKNIFKGSCFDYGFHAFIDANGDFVIGEERGREGGELYRGKFLGKKTPKLCSIKTENPILYNNIIKYFSENKSINENTIMSNATMTDIEKLDKIFVIYKNEVKKKFPQLYYAILAILDSNK